MERLTQCKIRVRRSPHHGRASIADLTDLDFEGPVVRSQSPDSTELGDLFRSAAGDVGADGDPPDTPACSTC